MPKSNSQQKSTPRRPHPPPASGGGMERSGRHCLGEGPARRPWEQSEGAFLKLWESKEKLTCLNTLPAVRKTKGLRNSREEPARPRWRKEAGGREGANSAPEKPPSPTLQTGPRFYLKTSWDATVGARWGPAGKRRAAPGRVRASLWLPELLRPGKTQHAGATESALLWRTRKLEPHSTQGLLHVEQPGAWAVQMGKAETPLYGASPVWPQHGECYPHTEMSVCSALPAPQQDWTELANLNKRSPPPTCARAEIRHRRDSKQKPNKQRESLQKGPVQWIKIPEGNTNYTGRGL